MPGGGSLFPDSAPVPVFGAGAALSEEQAGGMRGGYFMTRFPGEAHEQPIFSVGQAYWNQRQRLAERRSELEQLHEAVGHPGDLWLCQFAQFYATALEFQPDMIVELGRGWGNSTAAFLAAIDALGEGARLVSLCRSREWRTVTRRLLEDMKPEGWFEPLEHVEAEIPTIDVKGRLKGGKRVLVLWDAHGYDVAEVVLARIMPMIAERPHLVIMHDIQDDRYHRAPARLCEEKGIWRSHEGHQHHIKIGHFSSAVEQMISALDFLTRNGAHLESADHEIHREIASRPEREEEMKRLGGLYGEACWCYFSLNEVSGPFTFPKWRG